MDGLLNRHVVGSIKETFAPDGGAEREHNAHADSLGFGDVHHSLIVNLRPERVLVIGSRYGYIPGIIALALKTNECGVLDLVDANYSDGVDGFEVAFGGMAYWEQERGRVFAAFGLGDIVNVHVMRSADFFARCEERYGYIYIDGDHGYDGCRFDFEHALAVAAPGALIVLHDVIVTDERFGVKRLFDELDGTIFGTILLPIWPGLGIVQRKRDPEA